MLRRKPVAHAADGSHLDLREGRKGLYVNMFVGSRIHVGEVAGTNVEVIQKTDYPWKGSVAITVNPEETQTFQLICADS